VKDRWSRLTLRALGDTLDPSLVVQGIVRAMAEVDLHPIGDFTERWTPHGLTWCGWGNDFRLIVHTWPEHHLATIDLWSSAKKSEPVIRALEVSLGWRRVEQDEISRGNLHRARTAPSGDS
jgi:S-adenosylmethionine/arginine decarboxylase-like enzyme